MACLGDVAEMCKRPVKGDFEACSVWQGEACGREVGGLRFTMFLFSSFTILCHLTADLFFLVLRVLFLNLLTDLSFPYSLMLVQREKLYCAGNGRTGRLLN